MIYDIEPKQEIKDALDTFVWWLDADTRAMSNLPPYDRTPNDFAHARLSVMEDTHMLVSIGMDRLIDALVFVLKQKDKHDFDLMKQIKLISVIVATGTVADDETQFQNGISKWEDIYTRCFFKLKNDLKYYFKYFVEKKSYLICHDAIEDEIKELQIQIVSDILYDFDRFEHLVKTYSNKHDVERRLERLSR